MTKCNSCGLEIRDGVKFCRHCGAPVSPVAPPEKATQQEDQNMYEAKKE